MAEETPRHPCGARRPEGQAGKWAGEWGPHARTPARTRCGEPTPAVCCKDGQQREGERLTRDAPQDSVRYPPPPGTPPCHPYSAQRLPRKSARCGAGARSPRPHHQRTESAGNGPRLAPPRTSSRKRESAYTRHPSQQQELPPTGATSYRPRGAHRPAGHASQRASAGSLHPHTCAYRNLAADPNGLLQGHAAGGG